MRYRGNNMKEDLFINTKRASVDLSFGIKIGQSVYVVSNQDTPYDKDSIIDVFLASDLRGAVRRAVKYEHFTKNGWINLITGDGQVCRITLDK